MALLLPSRLTPASPTSRVSTVGSDAVHTQRDRAVDLTRVVLLGVVVLLHALMAGVARDESGAPLLVNAMEGWSGFAPLTWVVQVMPLFFVLGGFSGRTQWRKMSIGGATAGTFIAARMRRLLVPASLAMGAIATFLCALVIAGVPDEIIATAGFRIGQPFWFLAVYVGVTSLVPVMSRVHDRNRALTFGVLALGVVAVDAARVLTGVDALGLLNMAFVWLLLQQLGFALADGSFDRLTSGHRTVIAGGAVLVMLALVTNNLAPADLIAALNPPMGILVVLGIAQLMVFLRVRPALRRLAGRPAISRTVDAIGARSLTIYAWHMLVTIGLAGLLIALPVRLPSLLSAEWWLTRPLWSAVIAVLVAIIVVLAGKPEARRDSATVPVSCGRAVISAVIGGASIVVVLVCGAAPLAWALALIGVMCASALVCTRRTRIPQPTLSNL